MTSFRKLLAALATLGIFASGVGIASFLVLGKSDQQQSVAPRRDPPKPPPPSVPTVKEFLVGVGVTAQNCDPAGACVYTYTIDPKYVGLHPFPEEPFTVEYEVLGGHQPQPGKFTGHRRAGRDPQGRHRGGAAGGRTAGQGAADLRDAATTARCACTPGGAPQP